MFDVGFSELVLIAVVALLVVGPERLPKLARTAGLWLGRARRVVVQVKAEIDRELKAEELKELMAKQAKSSGVHEILEDTRASLGALQTDLTESAGKTTPSKRVEQPSQ